MMWWAVWCAAVVAGCAGAAAAPARDSLGPLPPLDLVQIDPPAPDDEGLGYAMGPVSGRYGGGASAPWLYFLAEPHDTQGGGHVKRGMSSLSIELPMTVLRQKLSLEKERKLHAQVAAANRDYLNNIGKRGFQWIPISDTQSYF